MGFVDHATCVVPADWLADVSQCWYEWQTLVGGGLALVAAYFTIRETRRQIAQVETHRKDELKRRHNAARIGMPFAVSEVSAMCNRMAEILCQEVQLLTPEGILGMADEEFSALADKRKLEKVEFSETTAISFKAFAETLGDDVDVMHLSELMSCIQILQARWASFKFDQIMVRDGLRSLLLDVAKVGYLNDRIFNYVRGVESKNFGVTRDAPYGDVWDGIFGKAFGLVFNNPEAFDVGAMNAALKRRKDDGSSPWLEKFEM